MTNSYGYNRKTLEQDEKILSAVRLHHEKVKAELKKHDIDYVVMTSLVGSQNYDLDDANSDIDTFTFFFPNIYDIMSAAESKYYEFDMPDGKCYVKDIRVALNLLKKTSPNSVEYFVSKYKIYDNDFKSVLIHYLDNNSFIYPMSHCDYKHMLNAIAGMAGQLIKRNMPAGKRYAHELRLQEMLYHFINSMNASSVLELRPGGNVELLTQIKRDENPENFLLYEDQSEEVAGWLHNYASAYKQTDKEKELEITGKLLIYSMQEDLFKRYISLNHENLKETIN